jgi:hypothetical protein
MRTLYRLLWGHHSINPAEQILPAVPRNRMSAEDHTIQRICTSTSLDGCLTGIGPTHIGLNYLQEMIKQEKEDREEWSKTATFPFTVIRFQVSRKDPDVLLPGKVFKYVPDAFESGECWILKPIAPTEVKYLWLIDGEIVESDLPVNGCKYRYLEIHNSVWSETPKTPNPDFMKGVVAAAREWLEQNS